MTDQSGEAAAQPQTLEQAVADLERLKGMLQQAGHGDVAVSDVQQAVAGYLRDHGDALATAAGTVGEQIRSQMLAELYRRRAQLLQRSGGSPGPTRADPSKG